MRQESGAPAPLFTRPERDLETPVPPARLRHPPLAQGAGPGTSPRRQGARAPVRGPLQPVRTRGPWGPTRAFSPCGPISP